MILKAPVRTKFETHQPPSPVLAFAQKELERYLARIFPKGDVGSALEIVFTAQGEAPLRFDGYELRLHGQRLIIASGEPRGILYGVYEFLKLLGCRFPFPLEELEKVPRHAELTLEDGAVVRNPWLEFRGLALYQATAKTIPETIRMIDWMTKNNYNLFLTSLHRTDDSGTDANAMLWDEIAEDVLPQLRKRGAVIDMSEHSTDCFFPRDTLFAEHPEWFALRDGKRVPGQICYSNPEAVKAYADSFVQFVRTNSEFDILGLWPLDGGGYCQCPDCAGEYTILNANIEIANKIGQIRPDLIVEYLAYTPESWVPPRQDLPPNMSVLVCDLHDERGYMWGARARNAGGAFFFDYLTGDNYRFRSNVWLNPCYCHEMANTFLSYHYRGCISLFLPITNWWQSCLNYGYLSQLYYDPTISVEAWINQAAEELFGSGHGDAGRHILRKIVYELQDRAMWSRVPHASPQYKARLYDRSVQADQAHKSYIARVCGELEGMLDTLLHGQLTSFARLQVQCLREYVQLQWLFFTGVDQYNNEVPATQDIENYLKALEQAAQKPHRGFISERFARFRIYDTGDVLYDA